MGLDDEGREEKAAVEESGEGEENATLMKLKERWEKAKAGESVQAPAAESEHSVELSDGNRVVEETEEFMGFSDTPEDATSDSEVAMREDEVWERIMNPESTDFTDFDNRIGASDSEDDDEDAHNELERTDDEWSGSDADADDERDEAITSRTTSPPPPPPPPQTQKQKTSAVVPPKEKKPKVPVVTSQFLPSLMSGYVSGGDSDPDVDWYKKQGKKKGPPEKKERKNRMGQQARRALWAKKFGKRAHHVQKEEQEAQEKRERKEARVAKKESAGEKTQEGPLHPSWEAARKVKEKQAQVAAAMMKPQGKKITFD